jgi:hypothetical protein
MLELSVGQEGKQDDGPSLFRTPPPDEPQFRVDYPLIEEQHTLDVPSLREVQSQKLAERRLSATACVMVVPEEVFAVSAPQPFRPSYVPSCSHFVLDCSS